KAIGKVLRKVLKKAILKKEGWPLPIPLPTDADIAKALRVPGVTIGTAHELKVDGEAFAAALANTNYGVKHNPSMLDTVTARTLVQVYGIRREKHGKGGSNRRKSQFSPELEAIGAPHLGLTLIVDVETTFRDVGQECRIGAYQLRGLTLQELVKLDRSLK